ncbi:DUF1919 domain-containing protein [Butyrivibrio sp. MC2021]|uniref:DUF1919 domain-containing protein n=1 Tax=Butyrivibrio sp. MC2021 TaxID=1408306 RepID=UPI00047B1499|nr:DUF1919 domain-containing protein [Butyrivibrio sp. MC2021]
MATYEGFRLKINKLMRQINHDKWKSELFNNDFTIISNNCWGGMVYESYGMKKLSPTVGLYFMASDYVKFVYNIKNYINEPLVMISPEESKYKDNFMAPGSKRCPIGLLNDIEIMFLHYKDNDDAIDKWNRRIDRINWDNLLFKFNDQNGCTEDDLKKFLELDSHNKLFFTCKEWGVKDKSIIKVKQPFNDDHIMASYEPFAHNRYLDVTKYLNEMIR